MHSSAERCSVYGLCALVRETLRAAQRQAGHPRLAGTNAKSLVAYDHGGSCGMASKTEIVRIHVIKRGSRVAQSRRGAASLTLAWWPTLLAVGVLHSWEETVRKSGFSGVFAHCLDFKFSVLSLFTVALPTCRAVCSGEICLHVPTTMLSVRRKCWLSNQFDLSVRNMPECRLIFTHIQHVGTLVCLCFLMFSFLS